MQKTMTQCWDHDPHRRPTMAEIKEWTKLPEFPSLRTVCRLPNGQLSAVCQCVVDRSHIHGVVGLSVTKLTLSSPTTTLSDEKEELFCSSITTSTKIATLLHKKASKYSQVWVTQESESKDVSHLSIMMYESGDLGYRVSPSHFLMQTNFSYHI